VDWDFFGEASVCLSDGWSFLLVSIVEQSYARLSLIAAAAAGAGCGCGKEKDFVFFSILLTFPKSPLQSVYPDFETSH
jgi:hypothetical protein